MRLDQKVSESWQLKNGECSRRVYFIPCFSKDWIICGSGFWWWRGIFVVFIVSFLIS